MRGTAGVGGSKQSGMRMANSCWARTSLQWATYIHVCTRHSPGQPACRQRAVAPHQQGLGSGPGALVAVHKVIHSPIRHVGGGVLQPEEQLRAAGGEAAHAWVGMGEQRRVRGSSALPPGHTAELDRLAAVLLRRGGRAGWVGGARGYPDCPLPPTRRAVQTECP